MARTQSKLATEMLAVVPTANAATAATNIAQAYGDYMKDATSNGVPTIGAFIDATCVPAMAAAMSFLSDDSAAGGAAKLVSGYAAFWAPAVATPGAFMSGATVIVPPTFAALASALTARFPAHAGPPGASLATAMSNLATDIHTATSLSPTATFFVPTFPIL